MKKLIALLLTATLCFSFAAAAMADTMGLGSITNATIAAAYTLDGTAYDGKVQYDTTMCVVLLGDDGIIKAVTFDVAQNSTKFTTQGLISGEIPTEFPTKLEQGDAYNMKTYMPDAVGEWYEQAAAFEAYCVGKTVAEVLATPLVVNEEGNQVPDVADLKTSCTIGISDFLAALEKAAANAK